MSFQLKMKFLESTSCQSVSTDGSIEIDGLTLIHNFLSESEESKILNMIDTVEWAQSQSGRRKQVRKSFNKKNIILKVQDYGPKVNFKHKKVKTDTFVGMPEYADMLLNKMSEYDVKKLGNYQPFEMCNLEYEEVKKSAIEMHQDDMWIWGNRLIRYEFLFKKVLFN